MISLMRQKFVEKYKWLSNNEMLDITAIAQSAPGAIAVNSSLLIGYRLAGIRGALVTIIATILPPIFFLTIISLLYAHFSDLRAVQAFLWGMKVAVGAIISDVVISMSSEILGRKQILPIIIMICAFLACCVFGINVVYILIICGCIGALCSLKQDKKRPKDIGGVTE